MVHTRVGYAGGTKENPTYHSLGDHSEAVQMDYNPALVSYGELLDMFWSAHSPTLPPFSRQYSSMIFYHDEEQRRLAEESKKREETRMGLKLYTIIVPYQEFYLAEDYHQKYWLQLQPSLMEEFRAIYPCFRDLVDSTAAARVNGLLGGYFTGEDWEKELNSYGLSSAAKERLQEIMGKQGDFCPASQK